MYLNKKQLKHIALLINTIDVREICMKKCTAKQDWEGLANHKFQRDMAIVKLSEEYKIPHALYNTAIDNLDNGSMVGWRDYDYKYV